MIVTPFGDLVFGNSQMMSQWLAAHAIRHRTLRRAFSRSLGSILPAPLFHGVDNEWVRLHFLHHVALLRAMPPDSSISVTTLSSNPTTSEALFNHWHHMHNLLHTRLDQALQVM